jgi:hypothetical protein
MISIITSVNDQEQYEQFMMPSMNRLQKFLMDSNLPTLDIIKVSGSESIGKNYNEGIRKAIYKVKVFIHQDVDMLEIDWAFKLLKIFADYPDVGLVGLVGTVNFPNRGFWWTSGREFIRGELWSGKEKADWAFLPVIAPTTVECIDGFFMATNRDILWDEDIKGFHCYDMDYSRTITKNGLKIMVMPHKSWHIGEIRDAKHEHLFETYYKKWNL